MKNMDGTELCGFSLLPSELGHVMVWDIYFLKNILDMINKETFDALPAGQVFSTGIFPNSPEGLFMTNSDQGKMLRWVAKKGWGNDWAIYCHWATNSVEFVTESGDKVFNEAHIKKCVPCDEEIFKLYRY